MIPDQAVLASGEISSTAFRLYAFYCMRRNRKSGGYNCPRASVAAALPDIQRASYFTLKKELLSKGWIDSNGDFIRPVKGFESPEIETLDVAKSPEIETRSPEIETTSPENETLYIRNKPAIKPAIKPERAVFEFWIKTMKKKPKTVFGDKRRSSVTSRLEDGYTVDQLKTAILGCSITPHNCGDNDRQTPYQDLELICRNETKVDQFIENWESHLQRSAPGSSTKYCDLCRDRNGYRPTKDGNVPCTHAL